MEMPDYSYYLLLLAEKGRVGGSPEAKEIRKARKSRCALNLSDGVLGIHSSLKPIFQRGVTDKRGVRPTIAREGSKLDFVRRGPEHPSRHVSLTKYCGPKLAHRRHMKLSYYA